jgi:hypothetical protein
VIERVARGRLQLQSLPVDSVTFADTQSTETTDR